MSSKRSSSQAITDAITEAVQNCTAPKHCIPSIAEYAIQVPQLECPQCYSQWDHDCSQAVAVGIHGKCIVCLVNDRQEFDLDELRGVVRCCECKRSEDVCGKVSLIWIDGNPSLLCLDCSKIVLASRWVGV